MTPAGIIKDFAGIPAVYLSLEDSARPKVHFRIITGDDWMYEEDWIALPLWTGIPPLYAYFDRS